MSRHLERHRPRTSALLVGYSRAAGRAGRSMLAGGAIGHIKDKVQVGIEGDGDLHIGD
jgi:ABC-type tungstate transport system substrate-binding protein